MKVKELMELLEQYPEDTRVVYTYDSIYGEISEVFFEDEREWIHHNNKSKQIATGRKIVVIE